MSLHELTVNLHLQDRSISVHDKIRLHEITDQTVTFSLTPQVRIAALSVDGKAVDYDFDSNRLRLPVPSSSAGAVTIELIYDAVFDDPPPANPVNFENYGFGVTGTITESGAFLLGGCDWYPRRSVGQSKYKLEVIAPRGVYAVTAGRLVDHESNGIKTISRWETDYPVDGLAFSAGPYLVRSRSVGDTTIFSYLFPGTDALSGRYLKAAASHIQFFEGLHGRYPFYKFAVVENFFPTGYGFPSYTLLGTRVLRLSFIPETSLKHEVAHSWWGNGVLVDDESGNWCEGLTTYVSDYLTHEMKSPAEAKRYRRQMLRDYAVFAKKDFPLRQFISRTSTATKAIGYGKAAFIFHMLRNTVGDQAFWQSLRLIFKERLFKPTAWDDFREVFSRNGDWDHHSAWIFFNQWINRGGAPRLALEDVRVDRVGTGWATRALLSQTRPYYVVDVPVTLETSSGTTEQTIHLEGPHASLGFNSIDPPSRLIADPENHVFRLLYPEEIPSTVNRVKGAEDLVAVFSNRNSPQRLDTCRLLLTALTHEHAPILSESEARPDLLNRRNVLFFGLPETAGIRDMLAGLPIGIRLDFDHFALDDRFSSKNADTLFASFPHPEHPKKAMTLFLPVAGTDEDAVNTAARKITHYGHDSYLTFLKGELHTKGVWEVCHSPLMVRLNGESQCAPFAR